MGMTDLEILRRAMRVKGYLIFYYLLLQADKANSKMRSLKRQIEEMVRH